MNHNFITAVACGVLFVTAAHAETTFVPKSFQFYIGMSGGVEEMTGKRNESLDEENQAALLPGDPARIQTTYNNSQMSEKNIVASGMAGFLWKIPTVPLWMGPEIYLGRGNTASSFSDVRRDPFGGGEDRVYTTDFQRKLFCGVLVRLGYQFYEKYLAYFSFGFDRSQFSIKRVLHHQALVPTTLVKRTKTMNGTIFGIGLEKTFDHFIVGFDARMIQYPKYNSVDDVRVRLGVTPAFLNFSVRPKIKMFSFRVSYRF